MITIGDHIRKRRLDLKLTQTQVANSIGVNEMTLVNWELNQCEPLIRRIPKIIDFLEYVPEDLFPSNTLGQNIKRFRLLHGMTRKQFARQLRVDETTLGRLEGDREKLYQRTFERIIDFLKLLG